MEVNFWKGHLRIGHQQIGWSRGLSILGTAQGFKTMLHRKRTDFKTLIEFWDNQISVYVRRYLFVAQPWRAFPASNGFVFFSFSKRPIWPSFKSCFCFSQKLPWAWFGPLDSTGSSWVLDVSGATIIWPSGLNLTSGSKATRIYLFLTGVLWKVCEVDHMQLGFGTWLGDWVTIDKAGKTAAAKPFGTGGSLMDLSSICMNLFCLLKSIRWVFMCPGSWHNGNAQSIEGLAIQSLSLLNFKKSSNSSC